VPTTIEGIEKYLGSGMIRGIGRIGNLLILLASPTGFEPVLPP